MELKPVALEVLNQICLAVALIHFLFRLGNGIPKDSQAPTRLPVAQEGLAQRMLRGIQVNAACGIRERLDGREDAPTSQFSAKEAEQHLVRSSPELGVVFEAIALEILDKILTSIGGALFHVRVSDGEAKDRQSTVLRPIAHERSGHGVAGLRKVPVGGRRGGSGGRRYICRRGGSA